MPLGHRWADHRRVVIVAVLVVGIAAVASFDAERQSAPPRRVRLVGAPRGIPAPVAVTGADPDATGEAIAVADYLEARERERLESERLEAERVAAEAAALEATRVAQARAAAAPQPARVGTRAPTGCDGHVIPGDILRAESGCDYGAVNPTGCTDGATSGCVGLYQFDADHFGPGGACSGLDWHSPADQDTCASRLSNGGTNLAPWGR